MMPETNKESALAAELLTVLTDVKSALKTGDLDQLAPLSRRQDDLIAQLAESTTARTISTQQMRILGQSAKLNQRLLTAAQAGLRSARQRNSDIHATSTTSQTYDRSGIRHDLDSTSATLEKRS